LAKLIFGKSWLNSNLAKLWLNLNFGTIKAMTKTETLQVNGTVAQFFMHFGHIDIWIGYFNMILNAIKKRRLSKGIN
jgi:hypothetical protein